MASRRKPSYYPNRVIHEAVVILLIVVLLLVISTRTRSVAMARLYAWSGHEHLWLVEVEERFLFRGPFFFTTNLGQRVFRITVKYSEGEVRRAWVRIGGVLLGMFSDLVDVRWDLEPAQYVLPKPPSRMREHKHA